jgi:hypothetical protein
MAKERAEPEADTGKFHMDYEYRPEITTDALETTMWTSTIGNVMKALDGIKTVTAVLAGATLAEENADADMTLSPQARAGLIVAIDAMASLSYDCIARDHLFTESQMRTRKRAH